MIKKTVMIGAALALVLMAVSMGVAAEKGSWTGWIADANCARDYAKAGNANHAACAKSCVSRGASWALAMPEGHLLLEVDAEEAEEHLGHEVIVKGELDEETNTVTVTAIEKPSGTD